MKNLILLTSMIFLSNNAFSQETSCNLMIAKHVKLVQDGVKAATSDKNFTKRIEQVLETLKPWTKVAKAALQEAYDHGDMDQYNILLDAMTNDTKPPLDWYSKPYKGKHEMRFQFTPNSNGRIYSYTYADLEMTNTNGLIDTKLFFDLDTEMPVTIHSQDGKVDIYSHYDSYESYVLSIKEVKDACIGEQFLALKSQSKKGREFYTGKTAYTVNFTREKIRPKKGLYTTLVEAAEKKTGCVEGDCKNGYGKSISTNGDVYNGQYINGKIAGYGEYYWSGGSNYKGQFKDSKRNGLGIHTAKNGAKKEGVWENNKFVKKQTLEWNGDKFIVIKKSLGCLERDCENGYGVYVFPSGDKYLGNYSVGMRDGYGKYTWKDGSYYKGNWEQNKMNGEATKKFGNGRKVEGTFRDGIPRKGIKYDKYGKVIFRGLFGENGKRLKGTEYYKGGDKYTGNFNTFGQRHGYGKHYKNGNLKYSGRWSKGKILEGTTYYENGDKYTGNYNTFGKRHGYGKYYKNGNLEYSGKWSKGKIVDNKRSNSSSKTKYPSLLNSTVNKQIGN